MCRLLHPHVDPYDRSPRTPRHRGRPAGVAEFVLLALLTLPAPLPTHAEPRAPLAEYTVTTWTDKDGLTSGRVRALAQDTTGYLWLGTDSGVIRFDGFRFTSWEALGLAPVPHGPVSTLLAARDGSLWIGFEFGGVARLHQRQVQMWTTPADIGVSYNASLMEDHTGAVWVVSRDGLHRYAGGRWENLFGRDGLPTGKEVMSVFEDSRSDIWVALRDSIFRRRYGQSRFEQADTLEEATLIYQWFSEDAAGQVWRTDLRTGARPIGDRGRSTSLMSGLGVQVIHDRQGGLWVGTRGEGLWRVLPGTEDRRGRVEHATVGDGLPSDSINALLEDRDGNIWVGLTSGLQRYSARKALTITTFGEPGTMAALPDGSMWVSTPRGLVRFAPDGRTRVYDERDGLPGSRVLSLNVNGDDLWVVTSRGLTRFDGRRFVRVSFPGLETLVRLSTTATQGDTVWLRDAQKGMYRLRAGVVDAVRGLPDAVSRRVFDMRVDRQGTLWVASVDGVLASVDRAGAIRTYALPLGDLGTLYDDHDGVLWVGGRYGLARIADGTISTVGPQNGLPGSVTAVIEDSEGVLWIACGSGILRTDKAEFMRGAADRSYQVRFRMLDTSEGTAGSPLSGRWKAARDAGGRLWFATGAGLTIIDPRHPALRALPPALRPTVEALSANGRRVPPQNGLRLPGGTSHIQFDYAALALTHPLRVRFRYRLDGVDSDWVNAGANTQASYANLATGRYRFHLMASDGSGDWVETPVPLEFTIEPRFHETSTFYAVALVGVGLLTWGAWQFRVRQIRHQLRQVLAERVRMSRTIHDTLLQGLAGLALHIDHLAETTPGPGRAAFVTLRRRVEAYLREARRSVWELRSPMLLDHDFVTALKATADRIFSDTHTTVSVHVEGDAYPCPAKIEEHILSIAHESMSNAFRHARAAHVDVHVEYGEHEFRMSIKDDGPGFDLSAAGRLQEHYGLATMREHADEARGVLSIATRPGSGTTVSVVVSRQGLAA